MKSIRKRIFDVYSDTEELSIHICMYKLRILQIIRKLGSPFVNYGITISIFA